MRTRLGNGGQLVIAVFHAEEGAHHIQGQIGPAAAHDGPIGVDRSGHVVPTVPAVKVEDQHLPQIEQGHSARILIVVGIEPQADVDPVLLGIKHRVGHIDRSARPEGHGI